MVLQIWSATDTTLSFWTIFCPFTPPKNQKNQKFLKTDKKLWRYHHFTYVPKIMIRSCMVPEIWCAMDGRTDGQWDGWMDGWTEKVTYRGGCPT